jgi:hypothetical protein
MRLRSGIRCDVLVATALAFAALLAFVPAALAAPPTETPAALHVVPAGVRLIQLQWDPPVDATLRSRVSIEIDGSGEPPYSAQVADGQTYWDEEVLCGETVVFTVVFENALGERGPAATRTEEVEPCEPGPPQGSYLGVSGASGGSVTLRWGDSPSNDVASMEVAAFAPDGFVTLKRVPWPLLGTTLTGLTCGTYYTFALTFIDFDGLRSSTGNWVAETQACATLGPVPDAPANLHLVGAAGKTATLAWDPAGAFGVAGAIVDVEAQSGLHETFHLTASPTEPTQITVPLAVCGFHRATVKVFYEDGRVSKAATLPVEPPCPAPRPRPQSGPIPYHRAGITLRRQARVTVARNGAFVLPRDTVQCPEVGGNCRVVVRVETRIPGRRGLGPRLYLGEAETTMTPGLVQTVTGRLSRSGRALLRRRGRLPVTITIEAWHVAGLYSVKKHTTFVPARR